ncbi:Di-copper centre-containing protein, partial [Amniculicola lignicola CBS 123094]
ATCASPRVRIEWGNLNDGQRAQYTSAITCLMGKPKKSFPAATNRYEDFVALHQSLTPNVHGNAKFLLWHRYYLWSFEQELRTQCGFTGPLPWFDESKWAGKFSQSNVFTSTWFGGIALGGGCVTTGKFANLACNIGPGSGNSRHCLARNGNSAATANTNAAIVDACNSRNDYADMAACAEGGAHAWGHNGIGAVMSDVYASPSDPVFWLHHAFIDRNFRIWQNKDAARTGYVSGTDRVGNPLTLDTGVSVNGFQPNVAIRDILDTMGTKLCYRYDY